MWFVINTIHAVPSNANRDVSLMTIFVIQIFIYQLLHVADDYMNTECSFLFMIEIGTTN